MSFPYYDWIAHHAQMRGENTALIDLATQRRFTYTQMNDRVGRAAAAMRARGVGKGDRVCILAGNSTDMIETQFAAFRIGAIWVPLNVRLTVPELEYIVRDAEPKLLIHDIDFAGTAEEVAKLVGVPQLLAIGAPYEAALRESEPVLTSRSRCRSRTSPRSCTRRVRRAVRKARRSRI